MTMMHYAQALNEALREEMQRDDSVFVFGEDIGRYSGVFKVTKDLQAEFGPSRVRDTPISEQALTAMAVSAAMAGTRPVLASLGGAFHSRRLTVQSSQVGSIPAKRRARWNHARRLAKALDLLRDPALDALLDAPVPFAELPARLPGMLALGAGFRCPVVQYPAE